MQTLTIGKVAKQAGVGIDTVRFYEREGLLPEARRAESGYRLYSLDDVDRLRFIRRAKTLGFSLEEIAELLRLNAAKGSRSDVKRLAQRRLAGELVAAAQQRQEALSLTGYRLAVMPERSCRLRNP